MDFSWIDIVIIIILIVLAIKGIIEGFVRGFLSFFLLIAAIIVAKALTPWASGILKSTSLYQNIITNIENKISSLFIGSASADTWANSAQMHNIPASLQNFMQNFMDTANNTLGSTSSVFSSNAADIIANIVSFLIIFIAALIIGKILIYIIDKFAQLPVIRSFNKIGGFIIGTVEGIILAVIFSTALYYINLFFQAEGLSTAINNSFLIKYFYISFLF